MKGAIKMMSSNIHGKIRIGVSYEDFAKVFHEFEGPPFFEFWTPDAVEKDYHNFDVEDAAIFGYYVDDEIAGLISMRPRIIGEHPVSYPEDCKVMYLSDIATLFKFRHMGIGTALTKHALAYAKELGYDYIYLRTNEKDISLSYRIAEKQGFHQIWDLCQEVPFPRTKPGLPEKDLRIFMEKKI